MLEARAAGGAWPSDRDAGDHAADAEDRDDAADVRACRAGRREAFAGIVRRHQDRIHGLALRWTSSPSDAADLAQEAFLRAYAALPRFDARRPLRPWLLRITVNACRDWSRRRGSGPKADVDPDWESLRSATGLPDEEADRGERRRAVRSAVAALPDAYRILVVLAYDRGIPLRDIAAATGLPLTVVKNRLFRARRMLADRLADFAPEGERGSVR